MKKIILIAGMLSVATNASIMKNAEQVFKLEWYAVTSQTYAYYIPLFETLKPIFIESFLAVMKPYVCAHAQGLVNISVEQEIVVDITESLQSIWDNDIAELYASLQNKKSTAFYIAVAKDEQQRLLGFALFVEENIQEYIKLGLSCIVEGSMESIPTTSAAHDQIFVDILAVSPKIQKKGVGKALLFSVFDHCQSIEKIYLTTRVTNKNALEFYDHIGFTRLLRVMCDFGGKYADFWREKVVYVFQKIKAA